MLDPIVIPDDEPQIVDPSDCVYPPEYEGHLKSLMIKRDVLLSRVQELAQLIHSDYHGRRPVLLCVLKGANPFYQHLLDALMDLRQGFTMEFLRVSSYDGTSTTGRIQMGGGLNIESLVGKHVILVEDIVDTGTTLFELIPYLQEQAKNGIRSLEVCALLSKRLAQPAKYNAKYVGFSIPNHFIIGYGLDYNELYRDLKDIWIISEKGIAFDAKSLDSLE